MVNLKIYQICHHLITYFATLISLKKSQLDPIFRTGGSIIYFRVNIHSGQQTISEVSIWSTNNKLNGLNLDNNQKTSITLAKLRDL